MPIFLNPLLKIQSLANKSEALTDKLAKLDSISISHENLAHGSKAVSERVVKIMHAEDKQQALNLNPVEAFYLNILTKETERSLASISDARKRNNLNGLLDLIRQRANGNSEITIPGMQEFSTMLNKEFPQLKNPDGTYAYAGVWGDVLDGVKSLASPAISVGREVISTVAELGISVIVGAFDADNDYQNGGSYENYELNSNRGREAGKLLSGSSDQSFRNTLIHRVAYEVGYRGYETGRALYDLGQSLSSTEQRNALPPADITNNSNTKSSSTNAYSSSDYYYSSSDDYSSYSPSINISSSEKDTLKRFYNEEAAKLLKTDNLSNSRIIAEDFMLILGMKKDDANFNQHIKMLLEKAIRDSSRNDFIEKIIDLGFPKDFLFDKNNNLLQLSLEAGNQSLIKKLSEDDLSVFNTLNQSEISPAHSAILLNHADLIKSFSEKGLDFNIAGKGGASPLLIGLFTNNNEAIDELLKLPNLDKDSRDKLGNNAVIAASMAKNSEHLEKLLNNAFNPNALNHKSSAAIHVLAYNGDNKSAELLIHHPETDINLKLDKSLPAVYIATSYDNEKIVEMLLNKGADLKLESPDGKVKIDNPLIFTVAGSLISGAHGAEKVADLLLERGFRLNEAELEDLKKVYESTAGLNPLVNKLLRVHGVELNSNLPQLNPAENKALILGEKAGALVSQYGNAAPMMELVDKGNYNLLKYVSFLPQMGNESQNLIHAISESGNLEAMRELLKAGADANMQNKDGQTALHLAAAAGNLDMIKLLSSEAEDNGWKWASAKALDKNQNTPLILAAQNGHAAAVKELILSASPVMHKNINGEDALSLATDAETRKILMDYRRLAGLGQ